MQDKDRTIRAVFVCVFCCSAATARLPLIVLDPLSGFSHSAHFDRQQAFVCVCGWIEFSHSAHPICPQAFVCVCVYVDRVLSFCSLRSSTGVCVCVDRESPSRRITHGLFPVLQQYSAVCCHTSVLLRGAFWPIIVVSGCKASCLFHCIVPISSSHSSIIQQRPQPQPQVRQSYHSTTTTDTITTTGAPLGCAARPCRPPGRRSPPWQTGPAYPRTPLSVGGDTYRKGVIAPIDIIQASKKVSGQSPSSRRKIEKNHQPINSRLAVVCTAVPAIHFNKTSPNQPTSTYVLGFSFQPSKMTEK